jgi:hypothetical protein
MSPSIVFVVESAWPLTKRSALTFIRSRGNDTSANNDIILMKHLEEHFSKYCNEDRSIYGQHY